MHPAARSLCDSGTSVCKIITSKILAFSHQNITAEQFENSTLYMQHINNRYFAGIRRLEFIFLYLVFYGFFARYLGWFSKVQWQQCNGYQAYYYSWTSNFVFIVNVINCRKYCCSDFADVGCIICLIPSVIFWYILVHFFTFLPFPHRRPSKHCIGLIGQKY